MEEVGPREIKTGICRPLIEDGQGCLLNDPDREYRQYLCKPGHKCVDGTCVELYSIADGEREVDAEACFNGTVLNGRCAHIERMSDERGREFEGDMPYQCSLDQAGCYGVLGYNGYEDLVFYKPC